MADVVLSEGTVRLENGSTVEWSGRPCPVCGAGTLELDRLGTVYEYCSAAGCRFGIGEDVIVSSPEVHGVSHRFGGPS